MGTYSDLNFYKGEDIRVTVDLTKTGVKFAEFSEVEASFRVGNEIKKTLKSSNADGPLKVLADPDNEYKCIVRAFRTETSDWTAGQFYIELKTIADGGDEFPDGIANKFVLLLGKFDANYLTPDA